MPKVKLPQGIPGIACTRFFIAKFPQALRLWFGEGDSDEEPEHFYSSVILSKDDAKELADHIYMILAQDEPKN